MLVSVLLTFFLVVETANTKIHPKLLDLFNKKGENENLSYLISLEEYKYEPKSFFRSSQEVSKQ